MNKLNLHSIVNWPRTFWCDPINILSNIFNVTSFAMNAGMVKELINMHWVKPVTILTS